MKKAFFFSAAALCSVSCSLLISAPLLTSSSIDIPEEELLSSDTLFDENTLLGQEKILAIDDASEEPPFEEGDSNVEGEQQTPSDANLQPNLQKVLYDPKLNYGTGSPIPKPAPITTAKRNLIVLGSSVIMATVAMLVVASNKGLDAPSSH